MKDTLPGGYFFPERSRRDTDGCNLQRIMCWGKSVSYREGSDELDTRQSFSAQAASHCVEEMCHEHEFHGEIAAWYAAAATGESKSVSRSIEPTPHHPDGSLSYWKIQSLVCRSRMTAQSWLAKLDIPRCTLLQLCAYVDAIKPTWYFFF